ncbi:MAG: YdcH family protein [Burkholderiales bacterium]|jgi:hypothetical protein|nr:YdcH family protein [Burkholderiales bacterium]
MNQSAGNDIAQLQAKLEALRSEHHNLDKTISSLFDSPSSDDMTIRDLKKRKLFLKDRIAALEQRLGVNSSA